MSIIIGISYQSSSFG
jgi:hypothetical protein